MELGTTLIGTICVAICAMPFILTTRNKNKIVKKQLTALKHLANKKNCEISQFEAHTYYAIGIDSNKNIISFISKNENTVEEQSVNLENIESCNVETINTPKKAKDIDKLYLKLTYKDESKASIILEFFNSNINYQLSEELQSINKWNILINNILKSNL